MAMHRTPTEILKARGAWRAKAREGKGEPKPPKGKIIKPKWLSGYARKAWERYAPICRSMGVLTSADGAAFGLMCCMVGEAEWAFAWLAKANDDTDPKDLARVQRMALNSSQLAGRFMGWFGLTPSGRAGLSVPKPEPGEGGALAEFKRGGKDAEGDDE